MDPLTEDLIVNLNKLATYLRMYDVNYWASRAEQASAMLSNNDFNGIEDILSWYGGMGSLNDLVICPMNGHNIAQSEVHKVNDELQELVYAVSRMARKIKNL